MVMFSGLPRIRNSFPLQCILAPWKRIETICVIPLLQDSLSLANLEPGLHAHETDSPFFTQSCSQPPFDGLSHGWTGEEKEERND